ncbi:AI-2E family transporter [Anaerosphaera multitolerans]|uniref:AI-2E family transporter n=1 Tax=Anaerosphaera multitolerans TaxID=2487351 RepID=A0A437S8T7_9FIRM|nr:AI-2E family transporter [Anaerosphaera multitolerans]RVU55519.1 AI-2E family transporter [Anaerosphaera multitolerans]
MNDSEKKNFLNKNLLITMLAAISFYFLLLNLSTVFYVIKRILNIISPLIIGAALAFVLKIPMNFLENKLFSKVKSQKFQKYKRPLALFLSILIVLFMLLFLIFLLAPQLIKSIQSLEQKFPIFFDQLLNWMRSIEPLKNYALELEAQLSQFSWNTIFENVNNFLLRQDSTFFTNAISTATSLISSLANMFVAFIFSIYILASKETLGHQARRMLYSLFSKKNGDTIIHILSLGHKFFYNTIVSQVTDATILGIMTFVTMNILRLPNAATISILTAFLALIPIFGAFIAGALGVMLILIESPTQALIYVIMVVILQQIEGNLIYPKVVGDAIGLPAMWTMLGVIVGGAVFGIIGMWLFVPLFAVIYTLLGEFTENKLNQKKLSIEK